MTERMESSGDAVRGPDQDLPTQVLRTMAEIMAVLRGHFAVTGGSVGIPSVAALRILERLASAPEPIGPSQLAYEMHLTRGAVTQTLQTLERRGLITRVAHATDRRMSGAEITPEGRQRFKNFAPALRDREARACETLSEAEQRQLLALLQTMLNHALELDLPGSPGASG